MQFLLMRADIQTHTNLVFTRLTNQRRSHYNFLQACLCIGLSFLPSWDSLTRPSPSPVTSIHQHLGTRPSSYLATILTSLPTLFSSSVDSFQTFPYSPRVLRVTHFPLVLLLCLFTMILLSFPSQAISILLTYSALRIFLCLFIVS